MGPSLDIKEGPRKAKSWLGPGIILLFVVLHLPYINADPVDHHSWRQVTTLGVARCFYYESADFFHPRVFERGGKSGVTGMECPIYNYIIFIFMKIFGYANWYGRIISLLFGALGLYWLWRLAAVEHGRGPALMSLLFLAVSPLYFFFSRNTQPDIPMTSLLIGSFHFIKMWEKSGRSGHFWTASILITAAALIKLPAIIFLPFFAFIIYFKSRERLVTSWSAYLFIAIPVMLAGGWYLYSRYLVARYELQYFYLGADILKSIAFFPSIKFFRTVIISRLPEIVANYAAFPFFVAGLALYKKIGYSRSTTVLLLLMIPYYIVGGFNLYVHNYYSLPAAPLVALVAGPAAWYLIRNARKAVKTLAVVLVVLAPVVGVLRTTVWYRQLYSEFRAARGMVERHVPDKALMVAAWRVDPTLLFFTYRNGWAIPPEAADASDLYARGARFLITTAKADSAMAQHSLLEQIERNDSLVLYKITGDEKPGEREPESR